jgi:serine/threonine protein kinase
MTATAPAAKAMTTKEAVAKVKKAGSSPEALFGALDGKTIDDKLAQLSDTFQEFAVLLHPDRHPEAAESMKVVTRLRTEARTKIRAGTYGKADVASLTGKNLYTNLAPLISADISNVYTADAQLGAQPTPAILKIVRDPRDEDLAENEARVLKHLHEPTRKGLKVFEPYLPKLIESTKIKTSSGPRRVNAFERAQGYVTLADILAAYPKGIDAPDVAWMWRRVLELLVWVHRQGVTHGAITPDHILLNPETHGGMLIDWSYAVTEPKPLVAISAGYEHFYPPEVLRKAPAGPGVDLFMTARCMAALLAGKATQKIVALPATVPQPIAGILDTCLIPSPVRRHTDAAQLYDDLKAVLHRLYGKPKFRKFTMPAVN